MKKVCTFAGHSDLYNTDEICGKLKKLIEKLIVEENVSEFLVGNYGSFDFLSAQAVRELKKVYPHIELNLVIPYLTKVITEYKEQFYEEYDNIVIADIPGNTPKKLQILKCNEYMVKKSHYIICYVEHSWGGAAHTLEYAKKKKQIKVLNLAEKR